ncbi:MAG: alpha/beta fold hydrolase [Cognaticolwellia sp.]
MALVSNLPALKEVTFTLGTKDIAALTNGNDGAPLVLCLHGWLDNAASFQPFIPYLSDYHVIAIDWPGHGFSSYRSDDAHYHFIDWVYDLLALFHSQQWQKVDIVAHSMGAMVASAFAAAFPEHVKSLTLIDAIGFLTADTDTATKQLRKGMLSRLTREAKAKNHHGSIDSAVEARMTVSDLTKPCAQLIVGRGIKQTEAGFIWRSDKRLRAISPYRFTLAQAKQVIADVKAPTQLLYGDKGMDMVAIGLKVFGKLFNDLTVHKLTGGHHVHMEQPEQTATLVRQLINTNGELK